MAFVVPKMLSKNAKFELDVVQACRFLLSLIFPVSFHGAQGRSSQ
jgi:hypothetical protein